ncbi:MAG TPA: M48 family metalloprotease [Vicinamibacteria bacterium]|nr:M48 family metalloprotease [Vicinamibacteria bacterium]
MSAADSDARRYHRRQLAVALADFGVGVAVLVAWQTTGATHALAGLLASTFPARVLIVAGMVLAVGGTIALLTFPLDILGGFWLPRRAGLLVQSFGGWLGDRAKALALGGGLTLVAAELVYGLLAWSPDRWWLLSAAILAAGAVLFTLVLPVWVVPLFYRLTPLQDDGLRVRLLTLAARVGVPAAEVSVAALSRKGRAANAAVVGLGRTRRILVADTLLGSFPPDEVEVVLAHELAHHARGHVTQGLIVQSLLLGALLWGADRILSVLARPAALAGPADPAGVPLLGLILTALGLVATPILSAWSRRLEREADGAAIEVTRAPAAFVAAMERLGALNLAERRPARLKELFCGTHPSLDERIARGQAAARRLAEAT